MFDIPVDKQLHFMGGAAITAVSSHIVSKEEALILGIAVGVGKEIYDSFYPKKHSVEAADFAATALGSIVTYAIMKVANKPTSTQFSYNPATNMVAISRRF